jgi:hypothetical protein
MSTSPTARAISLILGGSSIPLTFMLTVGAAAAPFTPPPVRIRRYASSKILPDLHARLAHPHPGLSSMSVSRFSG